VAEKLHAMAYLGELNSRMKDFYDVWQLCRQRWTPFFGPPNAEIKLVFQALPGLGFLCVCSAFSALQHGATPASSP
jgi:hypothetical protein